MNYLKLRLPDQVNPEDVQEPPRLVISRPGDFFVGMGPRRGLKLWSLACLAWVVLTIDADKKLFSPDEDKTSRLLDILTSSHLRNPVVTVVHPSKLPLIFS